MCKVLIAEDDGHIRELLVETLFDQGYDVAEAKDGRVALEKVAQEHPDVVLLDLSMPNMDGFQVMSKLKENPATEAIPVIVLTACPPIRGEQKGLDLGARHYITKPWAPGIVEATIRVALREAEEAFKERAQGSHVWNGSNSGQKSFDGEDHYIRTADIMVPLEKILDGGLYTGSLTLIEGATSSGKSVLCQVLAYGALMDNCPTTYFTSDHTPSTLTKQMGSLNLDVAEFLEDDLLNVYPVQAPIEGEDSGPLLSALALDMDRLPKDRKFIVVDSISNLVGACQEQSVFSFFSTVQRQCNKGRTIVIVAHSYSLTESGFARLRSLCDVQISLRTKKIGKKSGRMLEVLKANNMELERDNIIVFEVESGFGVRVIPFGQAKL